ncbi:hypothetical protein BFW38_06080 [Terasakiispira papahanaumokuakeensis]|uniref:HTH tetR-type domain-containing protein n=1 Tax=Terasakiispira papahanaumokuakeensis TaxID=197479 RepID=A0A1E2V836_9GAMM|nr:TetR/AcrR family transcriptional regulator [Terasakiispira papahanaumokuakeensis]ODC03178.1 hypothetical protein BFW38_06080 [Terasakiispira papahanaumokuakeensis]
MSRTCLYDRNEALDQAMRLFWRQGFHATSLKDLEQALDMRPGSIYACFGCKESLFKEAVEHYSQLVLKEMRQSLSHSASPLAGLADYFRHLGGLCISEGQSSSKACMLVKALLELNTADPEMQVWLETLFAQLDQCLLDTAEAAKAQGALSPHTDTHHLCRRWMAEIMGLRALAQRHIPAAEVIAVAEQMAQDIEQLAQNQAANA